MARGEYIGFVDADDYIEADFLDTEARYHYIIRSNSITHCNQMESVIDFADLYKCIINLFEQYGVLEKVREDLEIYFEEM